MRKQVLLVGASGTGKTELVRFMVEAVNRLNFNLGLEIFDMAVQNAEANLKGILQIEEGKSYFRYSRFARAVEKKNTLILLDELNRGDVMAQNILMPLLDSRRTLYIERGEREQIKVGEGTFFWATANIGYQFVGANTIDEAVRQRFQIIHIDFPDVKTEAKILEVRAKISKEEAREIAAIIAEVRKNDIIEDKPSVRTSLRAAELVYLGYPVKEAVFKAIYSHLVVFDIQNKNTEMKQYLKTLIND